MSILNGSVEDTSPASGGRAEPAHLPEEVAAGHLLVVMSRRDAKDENYCGCWETYCCEDVQFVACDDEAAAARYIASRIDEYPAADFLNLLLRDWDDLLDVIAFGWPYTQTGTDSVRCRDEATETRLRVAVAIEFERLKVAAAAAAAAAQKKAEEEAAIKKAAAAVASEKAERETLAKLLSKYGPPPAAP